MKAELIYNPSAGQTVVRRQLNEVIDFLSNSGCTVSLKETCQPGHATILARQAAHDGADVVIAAGGDGTVSEIAGGILNTDTALAVLPLGTTNVWALQMGIPALNPVLAGARLVKFVADIEERTNRQIPANYYRRMLLEAARVIIEGQTVMVDVGEVSGRSFLMWTGIGLDAALVHSVTLREKRALGSWAFILNALGAVGSYSATDVCLTLDGKKIETSTPLIIISNIQLYGGLLAIGAKASVTDGKLDVCIFKGDGFFSFAQHAYHVLSGQSYLDPNVEYCQASEIMIESSQVMPIHVDGDLISQTPIIIHVLPSALKAIVPLNAPMDLFRQ
jgi:diacylglycerol kinase (ATP)